MRAVSIIQQITRKSVLCTVSVQFVAQSRQDHDSFATWVSKIFVAIARQPVLRGNDSSTQHAIERTTRDQLEQA
ncbi:MAG: hypothetical protein CMJ35_05465 [Phycisphaerae bacterium]|nr:hypothetical protein [Phycisphaerae bacterium]MBM91045.1 hypothetical protein [Phycisphaerae bacterium]HCT44618.1 hypothetical protein [Phycisphaerales bacterium]|tara:strand:- start:505 stop:726 length:222 start_codon:yes stop_codon:yes gene_type:complete